MKRLLFKPAIAIASLWGRLFSGRLALVWQSLCNECYAAYLRHFFVGAEELIINGSPVCVTGGRFIRMGRRILKVKREGTGGMMSMKGDW